MIHPKRTTFSVGRHVPRVLGRPQLTDRRGDAGRESVLGPVRRERRKPWYQRTWCSVTAASLEGDKLGSGYAQRLAVVDLLQAPQEVRTLQCNRRFRWNQPRYDPPAHGNVYSLPQVSSSTRTFVVSSFPPADSFTR